MACWDMRFQLPISNHSHPARARVRRLLMHPLYQSSVIAGEIRPRWTGRRRHLSSQLSLCLRSRPGEQRGVHLGHGDRGQEVHPVGQLGPPAV